MEELRGSHLTTIRFVTVSINQSIKKICSARLNKHACPGIGTLRSVLELNRTTHAAKLPPRNDFGTFAPLTFHLPVGHVPRDPDHAR